MMHTPQSLADVLERDYFPPDSSLGKNLFLSHGEGRMVIEALRAQRAEVDATDMVPRSRYDACNADWLAAKAEVEKKQGLLTRVGKLLQEQTYTAAVIKILSDESLQRTPMNSHQGEK